MLLLWISSGSGWKELLNSGILTKLGVNTTANSTNRLSVKSDAVLLSHDDVTPGTGDLQAVLNKSAAAKDAGFVFQDSFSTRALFGLLGDDDFTLKVSPDGSSFATAIVVDKADGSVSLYEHSKFSAYVNYDKYIAADTWTDIAFNNARHNDQGDWSAGTFTAPADGYYLFGTGYRFKANSTVPDDIRVGLGINAADPTADRAATSGDATIVTLQSTVQMTGLLKLSAGDTVQAMAYMTTNDGYVEADSNHFWGCKIA